MYEVTEYATSIPISDEAAAGIFALGGVALIIWALVSLVCIVLWIWALIDCIKKEFPGSGKVIWILVIVLLGVIGAIIYLIAGKKSGTIPSQSSTPAQPQPAPTEQKPTEK